MPTLYQPRAIENMIRLDPPWRRGQLVKRRSMGFPESVIGTGRSPS